MIESFLRYLEHEKRYSAHTITSYKNDLLQFEAFVSSQIEPTDLAKVEYLHLRAWIVELVDDGISPRSVNRKIACLRAFYKFLLSRELCKKNPTTKLRPLKTDKKLPQFIRENEMTQLLDHLTFEEDFVGQRDRLIFEMLYGTGIRLSELINLKEEDISHYENTIKVLGKRNKERIIPIPDSVSQLIKDYVILRDDFFNGKMCTFLLVTESGKKSYPMLVYRVVKYYLDQVTTSEKKSPHVLRHSFATHLLNKGADLNAVKELLGHANLAATQVYTHNSMEKLKKAFDQAHPKAG